MDLTSTMHSLSSTHPDAILNPGLQACGVDSIQQPLLIPWNNSATGSNPPFSLFPMLNQPILTPLSSVPVSVPVAVPSSKNSLILVPLSSVSSHNLQIPVSPPAVPISFPALQPLPAMGTNEISPHQNKSTAPLAAATKSCITPLPILNQPALIHSQNFGLSFNGMEKSVAEKGLEIKSCHNAISSLHGKADLNVKNSGNGILKEGTGEMALKNQRRLSQSFSGTTKSDTSVKSDHAVISSLEIKRSNSLADREELPSGSNCKDNEETGQSDNENLSKIISSLPPGWKVVGLTSLDNSSMYAPCTTENHQAQMPSSAVPTVPAPSLNSHRNSSPPDVVSVDLNVSSAVSVLSSSSAIDHVQKLDRCSVPLGAGMPSSHLISVKSELIESGGIASAQKEAVTLMSSRNSQNYNGSDMSKSLSSSLPVFIKTEPESWTSSESESKETYLESSRNQWTVVGVTSLPFTTSTDSVPQNLLPNLSPLISSSSSSSSSLSSSTINPPFSYQNGAPVKPVSPKMTILNVPLPKTLHSAKNSSAGVAISLPETQRPKPIICESISNQIDASKENPLLKGSEWTIVGVTVAPCPAPTPNVFSDAGARLSSVGKEHLQNLGLISLDAMKTHAIGGSGNQQSETSFSEMIKALSVLVNKEDKASTLLTPQPQLTKDQWKVVGITQIPSEHNIPNLPEICHTSCGFNTTTVTSSNTQATCTASTSNASVGNFTVTSSSSSCITSSTVVENLVNNTLYRSAGTSSVLNIPESATREIWSAPFLNSQPLKQQPGQQSDHEQRNLEPVLQSHGMMNDVKLLNQFQNLVGVLPSDQLSQSSHHSDEAICNSPVLNSPSNLLACPRDTRLPSSEINICKNLSPSRCKQDGANRSKFQCIEKCIGKSDCMSRKAKDMCVRCMKKHTVSHLLKMKRMKDKEQGDYIEEEDKGDNFECVGQNFKIVRRLSDKIMKRLTKVDREGRSRPLHSYAGNRKMFSKPLLMNRNIALEKINLRSGTQVPVWNYESDCNENEFQSNEAHDGNVKVEHEDIEVNDTHFKGEIRSAARKRKLKVPRKMIADLDYHPFDSSSDSN